MVEKEVHLLHPFSGVHLGTRLLKSRGQVQKPSSIKINSASKITTWELLESVQLRTETLRLLGDNLSIFPGVR